MNTHPTHTQVRGWGPWPTIVPIGVGVFVDLVVVACILVWCVGAFLALVCVWREWFLPR